MSDYTWTIVTCEHDIATGGITVAHWRCSASEGTVSASAYGTCSFNPDASSEGFKPYDEVTEAEVLAWCWTNGVDKDATENSLASKVGVIKKPVTATGTPW
jgi:hypothetical protein